LRGADGIQASFTSHVKTSERCGLAVVGRIESPDWAADGKLAARGAGRVLGETATYISGNQNQIGPSNFFKVVEDLSSPDSKGLENSPWLAETI
jgi:hypothetical protein